MRKMKVISLLLILLIGLAACGNNAAAPSGLEPDENISVPVESSAQEETIDAVDDNIPFQLPEMTAEQQYYWDEYVSKLLWTGMLNVEWSSEDYRHLDICLMVAFSNILGTEAMRAIRQEYGADIPAEVAEEVLLRYFPFTAQPMREEILYSIFDEARNVYHFPDDRSGNFIGRVVNIERHGELVELSYDVYTFSWQEFQYHWFSSGILTLRQTDYGYMFWSVTLKAN